MHSCIVCRFLYCSLLNNKQSTVLYAFKLTNIENDHRCRFLLVVRDENSFLFLFDVILNYDGYHWRTLKAIKQSSHWFSAV